jgi:replicative DNA helicase
MAILATERVLTLDYWKPAFKVRVGDYVFDRKGRPVKVTLVQEYRAKRCYRVTFLDWLTISGDTHLAFAAENIKYRKRIREYKGVQKFRRPLREVSVQTLVDGPLRGPHNALIYSVPTTDPIQLPHQDLPVPPFVFGFWFFNRNPKKLMKVPKETYPEIAARLKDNGYVPKIVRNRAKGSVYFTTEPSIEKQLIPNIPTQIPNNYLMGSIEQRIELLSGIMHSHPGRYNPKEDKFMFSHRLEAVSKRIQSIAESLGSKTSMVLYKFRNTFRLTFRTHFKLLDRQYPKPVKVHHNRRAIISVTEIPEQLCVHIETDGEDGTFLVGEGYIACV